MLTQIPAHSVSGAAQPPPAPLELPLEALMPAPLLEALVVELPTLPALVVEFPALPALVVEFPALEALVVEFPALEALPGEPPAPEALALETKSVRPPQRALAMSASAAQRAIRSRAKSLVDVRAPRSVLREEGCMGP